MHFIFLFLSTGAAWCIAGLLTHLRVRSSLANGAVAGAFCTLLAYLLPMAGIPFDATLPALILLAFLLPVSQRRTLHGRLQSLLLSLGSWSLLQDCGIALRTFLSVPAAFAAYLLLTLLFLAAAGKLREHFPPEDQEPAAKDNDQKSMPVRRWYLWSILILMVIGELSLLYIIDIPNTGAAAFALAFGYTVIFWGAVFCTCLAAAYRQERLTALVDQDYRNEMQSFMSVIRSQRHDYNFHVQALAGLINDGNIEECRQYLNNLVKDSSDMNRILPVKDPAIAALIFSFRAMALEYGIELYMDIQNDLSCVATSVYETNKVIGNLLQNAIDEVRTHKDKSFGIHLYILKRGEYCLIHVANKVSAGCSSDACTQDIGRPGHSTKQGHEGIGLSSIQNLLRRYRGVVYSRMDGDIVHFIAKIPLEMKGETP